MTEVSKSKPVDSKYHNKCLSVFNAKQPLDKAICGIANEIILDQYKARDTAVTITGAKYVIKETKDDKENMFVLFIKESKIVYMVQDSVKYLQHYKDIQKNNLSKTETWNKDDKNKTVTVTIVGEFTGQLKKIETKKAPIVQEDGTKISPDSEPLIRLQEDGSTTTSADPTSDESDDDIIIPDSAKSKGLPWKKIVFGLVVVIGIMAFIGHQRKWFSLPTWSSNQPKV